MDSIDVYAIIDVVWALMAMHMGVGLAWAKIPQLSQMYVRTATMYAAVAMEAYVKAKADGTTEKSVLQTHEQIARIGLDRANVSLDYYANQRKFFINMLWITELRWAAGCLKGIMVLNSAPDKERKWIGGTQSKKGADFDNARRNDRIVGSFDTPDAGKSVRRDAQT